jgi:hypothetical protein
VEAAEAVERDSAMEWETTSRSEEEMMKEKWSMVMTMRAATATMNETGSMVMVMVSREEAAATSTLAPSPMMIGYSSVLIVCYPLLLLLMFLMFLLLLLMQLLVMAVVELLNRVDKHGVQH